MRRWVWIGWDGEDPVERQLPVERQRSTQVWLAGKLAARVLFAAFIVFGTYNPTGRSYYHWMRDSDAAATWKLIASGLLVVAYSVAVPIVWRALGPLGLLLTTVLATTACWVLIEAGWISLDAPNAPVWIFLSVVAFVGGVGLCWMLFGRILDGQLRTRDITL
jgi:hypothetical protein